MSTTAVDSTNSAHKTLFKKVQKLKLEAQLISGAEEIFASLLLTLVSKEKFLLLTCSPKDVKDLADLALHVLRHSFHLKSTSISADALSTPEHFSQSFVGHLFAQPSGTHTASNSHSTSVAAAAAAINLGNRLRHHNTSDVSASSWGPSLDDRRKRNNASTSNNASDESDTPRVTSSSSSSETAQQQQPPRIVTSVYAVPSSVSRKSIPNAVVIENLALASESTQRALVDMVVRRQIVHGSSVLALPKPFICVLILPDTDVGTIDKFLVDHIFLSHHIDNPSPPPLANSSLASPTTASTTHASPNTATPQSSQPTPRRPSLPTSHALKSSDIETFAQISKSLVVHSHIHAYINNIVVSIRRHPVVENIPCARVSGNLLTAVGSLASLSPIPLTTPDQVTLLADKVLTHHIQTRKRSPYTRTFGDDPRRNSMVGREDRLKMTNEWLKHVNPRSVVWDVLETLETPI